MAVAGWLEAVAAAFQFLTRFPLPVAIDYKDRHFRRSLVFYPVVGLAIGGVLVLAGAALRGAVPGYMAGILLVGLWTAMSGGLHLDGLMDTADGLLSHRSRERMLEIMKDSRVGAMGVMVCVFYALLKVSAAAGLLGNAGMKEMLLLLPVPVWSRAFLVTAIVRWPYARRESGLGALYRTATGKHAFIAFAAAFAITALLFSLPAFGGWSAAALAWTAAYGAAAYGVGAVLASAVSRKLGGLTGDVYGALNECIELVLLLGIAIYRYHAG
ncbi:adenosylcobinamide-GDP ribazoletransferase [Cohnella caldifontis]|uniref:adenosylcobinamide-GDP ribazoletransferase n=1 Tax=Cohnella caldifontis TaxID=3027471 RepID=UPI0023EE09C3|nr:adenosylcobinamide-GDP ribazoletransferase [Cohnella sp. YIM B05605]